MANVPGCRKGVPVQARGGGVVDSGGGWCGSGGGGGDRGAGILMLDAAAGRLAAYSYTVAHTGTAEFDQSECQGAGWPPVLRCVQQLVCC